jgi:hypothetical protein
VHSTPRRRCGTFLGDDQRLMVGASARCSSFTSGGASPFSPFDRIKLMTEPPSRLRALMMTLAPIALGKYDRWLARRERARRGLEQARRDAIWEPPSSHQPQPRERIRIGPPREGWRLYADQLSAERRRMTFTNYRGMHDHR